MNETSANQPEKSESELLAENMSRIAEQSQRLVNAFLAQQTNAKDNAGGGIGLDDPLNVGNAFLDMTAKMMSNPGKLFQAQVNLWQDYMRLWQHSTQRMLGQDTEPLVDAAPGDRRFKDPEWRDSAVFDFIKQSYLLTARWMQQTVGEVEGLDNKTARKVDFYTRQFVDAMAPSNFVMTNPEVLRETLDSKGENLVRGLENMLGDLERGKGQLRIKMTDMEAFKVGDNIAVTPGQVVFRNDLMELIQYEPATETVHKRPLLIIPPWINKYYILDLRPKNSFVKWAREQGHTVFMISWVNPDVELAEKGFEDYMFEGPLAALDAIEKATGEREVNALGLCLGGTLLSAALAYMADKGDDRFKSATILATLVDFEEPGELSVFIDEEQIASIEERMRKAGGYLDAADMATAFNMLRANDLIWSFVVNNYLMGKDPFPFDLLYWNSDSTRMPAKMHSYYLRNMYQRNLLAKPGGLELAGVRLDLGKVETPLYVIGTREDHIAPWKSVYRATQLFGGPIRFVLGGSGHIAGMTNAPPDAKYGHWTNNRLPKSADKWFEGAKEHKDSWWVNWQRWGAKHGGAKVPARTPGDGDLPVLCPAPGTYVNIRADN